MLSSGTPSLPIMTKRTVDTPTRSPSREQRTADELRPCKGRLREGALFMQRVHRNGPRVSIPGALAIKHVCRSSAGAHTHLRRQSAILLPHP